MKKFACLFLTCCLFFTHEAFGQNEKFKALFIYNFTKYIEWPSKGSQHFVIMVLGDSPIVNELNTIAQVKKVGSSAISVKKVQSVGEVTDCQIVYVSNSKSRLAPDVIARLQGKNVLVITDELIGKSGFGINFVVKDGKQAFEVSKGSIENNGLKINSGLLALGISVK